MSILYFSPGKFFSYERSKAATFEPSSRNRSQTAAPMPPAPPVTITTLSLSPLTIKCYAESDEHQGQGLHRRGLRAPDAQGRGQIGRATARRGGEGRARGRPPQARRHRRLF